MRSRRNSASRRSGLRRRVDNRSAIRQHGRMALRLFALLGFVGGLGLAASWAAAVLADSTLHAPAPTAFITDRDGGFLTQAGHESQRPDGGRQVDYGYWPVDPAPRIVAATLALEDRRFWSHPGVDPAAVLRAIVAACQRRPWVGSVHPGDAGRPHAASAVPHAVGEGGGGGHCPRADRPVWPCRRAGAVPAAGTLR